MNTSNATLERPTTADEIIADELLALLDTLDRQGYEFVTPTPATHARVLRRPRWRRAEDVRGVFGWSLPFDRGALDANVLALAERAGVITEGPEGLRSTIRVSRVAGQLLIHSAYPTIAADAVFLGPDSQKLAHFIEAELAAPGGDPSGAVNRIVDLGAGTGVAGIVAGRARASAKVTLVDINPRALRLAAVNARHAGVEVETVEGDAFQAIDGPVDLAVANPPFMADGARRRYRDGGDMHGARLSLDWALAAGRRLEPGGRFLLYAGSAIVNGEDHLRSALENRLPALHCDLRYREVDPDIFGEELEGEAYADVERIAAVTAVITRH